MSWNLIWGFPHELEEDYRSQLDVLREIIHLPPPLAAGRIWMERFSPLFFDRSAFPVKSLSPERSYALVYPKDVRLDRVAYFFDYELENTLPDSAFQETLRQIERWRSAWGKSQRPKLTFWHAPEFLTIHDARKPEAPAIHSFEGNAACLYAACSDRPRSIAELKQGFVQSISDTDARKILDRFCDLEVMLREENQFLSLALPASHGR